VFFTREPAPFSCITINCSPSSAPQSRRLTMAEWPGWVLG
jgi:hypothetical protein